MHKSARSVSICDAAGRDLGLNLDDNSATVHLPLSKSVERYLKIKRVVDVIFASVGLLVTGPLMAIIALVLRLSGVKPLLFKQRRPGLNEKPFVLLKFKTMTDERDANGVLLPHPQRLTRIGKLLRRASLDELPQFWNILRGDLSLVGPRPLFESYVPYYTPAEQRRHLVRPGLTGWAAIHGRNCVPFDERLALDVWYVDHISWRLDLRIILATVWIVLTQRGTDGDPNVQLVPLDVQRAGLGAEGAASSIPMEVPR